MNQQAKSDVVVYNDGELELKVSVSDESITQKIRVVQKEGKREVERELDHYNLDMIISIGYRVNSITATKFRQWATSILKSYITNGYVINGDKITNERFVSLENEVITLKSKVEYISNSLKNSTLQPTQGIFFD